MPVERCRVLVAPDKFKGSLTAAEAADRLARGLRSAAPGRPVRVLPVADGGDGTVDAAVSAGFERRIAVVPGPVGEAVSASFALRGEVAVVELAEASGSRRLPRGVDPLGAHTRGTGALIAAALDAGAATIVLGVGGSASTDAGTGLLAALGVQFVDNTGRVVADGGGDLQRIASADLSRLDSRVRRTRFLLASDVDNPLLGPNGAAAVYGPQKGATAADVAFLEAGLRNVVRVLGAASGGDESAAMSAAELPGAGAAGGAGYAALAVLGAVRRSGIELVLDTIGFDGALADADLVVTGEGCLDAQTLRGKAPAGVARAAGGRGVPVVAVCGRLELSPRETAAAGFAAVYCLADLEPNPEKSLADAGALVQRIGERIARDWAAD